MMIIIRIFIIYILVNSLCTFLKKVTISVTKKENKEKTAVNSNTDEETSDKSK